MSGFIPRAPAGASQRIKIRMEAGSTLPFAHQHCQTYPLLVLFCNNSQMMITVNISRRTDGRSDGGDCTTSSANMVSNNTEQITLTY